MAKAPQVTPTKTPVNSAAVRTELVAFVAGGVKLKPGDKLPEELVVVPWGRTETNRGPVICDERTLAVFESWQAARRRDHVMGDYNHASMPGRAPVGQPVPKAAKGKARVVEGVGVVVDLRADAGGYWTRSGEEYVGGGHYPDISPAIERDENGVVYGLHSWAFCEHGEMKAGELELFTAAADAAPTTNQTNQTKPMDYKKLLCTALGLPEDASDEQITAAVAKAGGGNASTEGMSAVLKKIEAFSAQVTAKLDAFEATEKKRSVTALIEGAKLAGKEIKLDEATLIGMGAEAAGKYLETLSPGVIPLSGAAQGGANAGGAKGKSAEPEGFSAEELEEAKALGLDPEKLKANLQKMTGPGNSAGK
jgi:phage I-like protein